MPSAAWKVSPEVERYDVAVDWFRARTVITADAARELDDRTKADSFWVGGGLQLDQIQRVFDKIATAIENGTTLEDFKRSVRDELRDPAHVETVFRNATQRAYNAGRYLQMSEPQTMRFRPFWLFDAILDTRTTQICIACNKTLLPVDDPWWKTHIPPLHQRCRSSIRNLTRAVAEERGITDDAPDEEPDSGWGLPPTVQGWRPAKNRYEKQLEFDFDKAAAIGEKRRKPRTPEEHKAAFWEPKYAERYGNAAKSLAAGRAALERGLDMRVEDARALFENVRLAKVPGVSAMVDALEDADADRTLREQAGELDPLRKAAAAFAGHLQGLKTRAPVAHRDLTGDPLGKRATDFMTVATGPRVKHPGSDWNFVRIPVGGITSPKLKAVEFDRTDGTLEHEWGHVMEALNPRLFDRAIAFLDARAKGEPLVSHGYLSGQSLVSWDDQFLYFYTGRKYTDRQGKPFGTEITSTALELLIANRTHWGTLSDLVRKDLEHYLFMLGQLGGA